MLTPQYPGSPGLAVAPRGGTRPSRTGDAESQALGSLQDPTGPSRELCSLQDAPCRQRPRGPTSLQARASPVQDAPAQGLFWGHTGHPRTALPRGPRARNERDGQTQARHSGSEKGLQDRGPGHALWSTPPLRQINLITATRYQEETGTLYFLPPILSDKIRDWSLPVAQPGSFSLRTMNELPGETDHRQCVEDGSSSRTSVRRH